MGSTTTPTNTHFCKRRISEVQEEEKRGTHKDDALKPGLIPRRRIFLRYTMVTADSRPLNLSLRNAVPRAAHNNVKVHAEDTNPGIVSCTKVNVLLNPKTKVARLGKVAPTKFVLLHLETTLENLLGFRPTNRNMDGNLFVAPDSELADGVAGFGCHWCLARKLFKDFGCSRQTITGLSDGYVCRNGGQGRRIHIRKEWMVKNRTY